MTDLHYVTENIGHNYSTGSMVTAVKQIYEDLGIISAGSWNASESDYASFGKFERFYQEEFVGIESPQKEKNWDFSDTVWDEKGSVYIPDSCYTQTCSLHVSFHGCYNNASAYATQNQLRELAANNNIILLFPESYCWNMTGPEDSPYDSYEGVDDEYWLTRDGLYPQAIMAMICRLTSTEEDNDCPVSDGAGSLALTLNALALAYLMVSV